MKIMVVDDERDMKILFEHSGELKVETKYNEGSEFIIKLPNI